MKVCSKCRFGAGCDRYNLRKDTKSNSRYACPTKPVYVCVFTDFATRYTHLELMQDRKTTSFLQCGKRMSNFFGAPISIQSDNGGKLIAGKIFYKTYIMS